MNYPGRILLLIVCLAPLWLRAQTPVAPDWALPGSATHKQVPPPVGFHRPTITFATPLGIFDGQSDIGGPLLPGNARYDSGAKQYTLSSASYNIWYNRDEFRYAWKRMSGDASLVADLNFPEPKGYSDRKAVLVFRQDLDDDSKEIMAGLHGRGLIHLAVRPEKDSNLKEACRLMAEIPPVKAASIRLGIEKHGDTFALFASLKGEPMRQVGTTAELHLEGSFYVGIGFCSHLPVTSDTAVFSNLVLSPAAGKVQ